MTRAEAVPARLRGTHEPANDPAVGAGQTTALGATRELGAAIT